MKKIIYIAVCASTLLQAQAPNLLSTDKRTFSQSQYIPDISLIVDTSFASRNKNQEELSGLFIPGITEGYYGKGEHGHSAGAYSSDNGFNFNYSELIFSANVDPSFSLDAVFHFGVDSVEIDEAYFTNTTLADGLRIRGGKFLSEFGRINNRHQHFWNFNEAPLIYSGFLGAENLNEIGLQAQYTLPIDTYTMVGMEVLQGVNEQNFGYEGFTFNADNNASTVDIKSADAPAMLVAYVKTAFDIGDTTIVPGLSYIYGESKKLDEHDGKEMAFDGTSAIYHAELTLKHYLDSYSFISWENEWMRLEKKGDEYHVENGTTEVFNQKITQEGYYSQLVYAHNANLRFGVRYESIYKNDFDFSEEVHPSTPYNKYTAMTEYHFSEFSRLRLEYSQNNALYSEGASGFESQKVNSLILSLNLSIGAHGAHDF